MRKLHYEKHQNEFEFGDDGAYENAADAFMAGTPRPPIRECFRVAGDRVRYNRKTGEMAVIAPSGFLKTYHKISEKFLHLGYFKWECGRIDL